MSEPFLFLFICNIGVLGPFLFLLISNIVENKKCYNLVMMTIPGQFGQSYDVLTSMCLETKYIDGR